MSQTSKRAGWIVGGAGAVALFGLGCVARTWSRYGRVAGDATRHALLDRFIPASEVADRHEIRVAAPAASTYAAACEMDLQRSRLVRAIFRGRELPLGGHRATDHAPGALLAQVLQLGWGVLAEEPGREVVVGAVTRPWEANVRFQRLPADEFAAFDAPGYVKIVWTLSAEPLGPAESVFRTEVLI